MLGGGGDGVLMGESGVEEGVDVLMEELEEGVFEGEAGEVEIGAIFVGGIGSGSGGKG